MFFYPEIPEGDFGYHPLDDAAAVVVVDDVAAVVVGKARRMDRLCTWRGK